MEANNLIHTSEGLICYLKVGITDQDLPITSESWLV